MSRHPRGLRMQFRRVIILGDGFGATPIRAASTAADHDLLYARAACAWLAKREARRYNTAGRTERAVAVARRIEDAAARANLLTSLAGAALASNNWARATELLDEAAGCALTARPSIRRTLALVGIAESFTAFDAKRGFEFMQTAVEAINEVLAQKDADRSARSNPGAAGEFEMGELYGSGFEAAFAALDRADFEQAWSLAEQLTARDISVLAQLAVCRGGLARP